MNNAGTGHEHEPTLLRFRRVIAAHLSSVLGSPTERLIPLIQQNTSHRKQSHSVFFVVIKRLQNALPDLDLDERVLEQCLVLSSPTVQQFIAHARRSRDMLLFDPVPLQLIQESVQSVYTDLGPKGSVRYSSEQTFDQKEQQEQQESHSARSKDDNENDGSCQSKKRDQTSRLTVLVNGARIQQDENAYCALRRTVLTGFVARKMATASYGQSPVKVIMDADTCDTANPALKGFYNGLDLIRGSATTTAQEDTRKHLTTIKNALQNMTDIKAQLKEGIWTVDLSGHKLGQVKVFTTTTDTMETPTLTIETLVVLARHFSEFECERYLWVVPESRKLFVEQVLHLADIIFPNDDNNKDNSDTNGNEGSNDSNNDNCTSGKRKRGRSWRQAIEVVYFGPTLGVIEASTTTTMSTTAAEQTSLNLQGLSEYAIARMREAVVENRGRQRLGTDDDDGYEDSADTSSEPCLSEEELARMATILSTSALSVSSAGSRRLRKLNIAMSRILDGKGNSGVFLHIERKSKTKLNPEADMSLLQQYPEAFNLALVIAEWHDTLVTLQQTLDPHDLVTYLFNLAAEIGQANRVLRVKDMDTTVAEARWLLFWASKRVLEQGLQLLGLESIEQM
ncbi:Arginyl-tRNA synthetase [Haplosporangium sp. Z 11]|nr:Arginyl-tRNA synthetase [Haplosporangium sp. Z 11]